MQVLDNAGVLRSLYSTNNDRRLGAQTAVDHEHASGRKARRIGGEIKRRACHFVGLSVTPERNDLVEEGSGVPPKDAAQILFHVQLKFIVDRPGMDRVDTNVARGCLFRQYAHQPNLSVLCRDVSADTRVTLYADDAGGDDDRAAIVHVRQGVLGGQERALDVDGEHAVENILRIFRHRSDDAEIAGIAEQDVDLAPAAHRFSNATLDLLRFGNVGDGPGKVVAARAFPIHIAADVSDRVFQGRVVEVDEHHLRSLPGEEARGSRTDTARSAGNEADLVLHLLRHEGFRLSGIDPNGRGATLHY